jgi:nicotinamide mononucleotide transporter
MSLIEVIAVAFSFLSVVYTVNKNIWSWIWGVIGVIFYGILFFQNDLLSNMMLQFIFIGQSIYGIWNWNQNSDSEGLIVNKASNFEISMSLSSTLLLSILLQWIFVNSAYPIMDSTTTALSIVAYYLMSKRKIENWIFWILADIIYIYMFFLQKLYLSSLLYLIFSILCIIGYKRWKNGER